MDAQLFIYTRGYLTENDYKLMYYPSEDFCSEKVRKFFRNQAKGAINTEKYPGFLDEPRWLFSRYKGMVLWGMAILNKKLCPENPMKGTDYTGREVRGFFGMVVKDGSFDGLPFDINYFKKLYLEYVIPSWSLSKESFRHGGVFTPQDFSAYEMITAKSELSSLLNSEFESTFILSNSISNREYLSAVLSTNKDISLITNLHAREHAFDHSFYYCNATVVGVQTSVKKIYTNVNHTDDNESGLENRPVYVEPEQPKKVLRLRVIRAIIVVSFIILVAMLTKRCKNSLSGEQIMTEQLEPMDSLKKQQK